MKEADLLREGGEEGQFLNQRGGRELQRERSGGRKEGGLSLGGQIRTHMVRVFGNQGLLRGARMRRKLR